MIRSTPAASALLLALMLGACATTQVPPQELVDARASVRNAEADPTVLASAPLELKKATDSLNRANTLLAKGEPNSEVTSAAYIADRQARTAMAIAQAKRNEDAIKSAEADRERARADINAAEAQRAQAQANTAQAQASVAQAQASNAQMRANNAEQRASNSQMQAMSAEASAAEAQARAAALQQQMLELQARQTERGLLVTLGDVLFEFNRADIKPTAQSSLIKLADFLNKHPERRVLIEGYTDNIGSASYNEDLSRRRAEAVASALAALGVAPGRVSAVGFGKDNPIAANTTDTNRALNRRVEVYIAENDQPVRARR